MYISFQPESLDCAYLVSVSPLHSLVLTSVQLLNNNCTEFLFCLKFSLKWSQTFGHCCFLWPVSPLLPSLFSLSSSITIVMWAKKNSKLYRNSRPLEGSPHVGAQGNYLHYSLLCPSGNKCILNCSVARQIRMLCWVTITEHKTLGQKNIVWTYMGPSQTIFVRI